MSGRQARSARRKVRIRWSPHVLGGFLSTRFVVARPRRLSRRVHRARRRAGQLA